MNHVVLAIELSKVDTASSLVNERKALYKLRVGYFGDEGHTVVGLRFVCHLIFIYQEIFLVERGEDSVTNQGDVIKIRRKIIGHDR